MLVTIAGGIATNMDIPVLEEVLKMFTETGNLLCLSILHHVYSPRVEGLWSVKLSEDKIADLVRAMNNCPNDHEALPDLVR